MALPPLEAGAVQLTVAWALPAVAVAPVGAPGAVAAGAAGVTPLEGAEAGLVLFLYAPARAGRLIEEQQRTGSNFSSMTETERAEMLRRYDWELLGPSPL